jgi:hypothetical protein
MLVEDLVVIGLEAFVCHDERIRVVEGFCQKFNHSLLMMRLHHSEGKLALPKQLHLSCRCESILKVSKSVHLNFIL